MENALILGHFPLTSLNKNRRDSRAPISADRLAIYPLLCFESPTRLPDHDEVVFFILIHLRFE